MLIYLFLLTELIYSLGVKLINSTLAKLLHSMNGEKPIPKTTPVLFEDIHTPGAYNQSSYALLGEVKVFHSNGKYILSACHISRSGKLHVLVLEDEDWEDLFITAIRYALSISTPWDRTSALRKLIDAFERVINVDQLVFKIKLQKMKEIGSKIAEIVRKYGRIITIRSGSTNLYSDDWRCYESFGEYVEITQIAVLESWKKSTLNEYKEYKEIEEDIVLIRNKTQEEIGIAVRHYETYMYGFESGGNQYYVILAFKPMKVKLSCGGRFCVPAEIGYEQEYRQWTEEIEINPPAEEVVKQVKQLLNELMSINP